MDVGRTASVTMTLECTFGRGSLVGHTCSMVSSTFFCCAWRWGCIKIISILFNGFFFLILSLFHAKPAQEHRHHCCTPIRLGPHKAPFFLSVEAQHCCVPASILPISGRDGSICTAIYAHMHKCTSLCERVHSLYSCTLPV